MIKTLSSWPVTILALLIFITIESMRIFPGPNYWYKVNSVDPQDAVVGQEIFLNVEREILRPFYGEWTVSVRDINTKDVACRASGSARYEPGTKLPDPLTLNWWTDGVCKTLPKGVYRILTTWEIRPHPIFGTRLVINESATFEVK